MTAKIVGQISTRAADLFGPMDMEVCFAKSLYRMGFAKPPIQRDLQNVLRSFAYTGEASQSPYTEGALHIQNRFTNHAGAL